MGETLTYTIVVTNHGPIGHGTSTRCETLHRGLAVALSGICVGLLVVLAASPLEAGSILFSADTASTADLEVMADDPDPVLVGATLTYTIVVTNYGPSTSTAELTDTLPASVTFVSATSTAGSCGESEGTVTCSLGVLDSGSSATTTIEVIPTATGASPIPRP